MRTRVPSFGQTFLNKVGPCQKRVRGSVRWAWDEHEIEINKTIYLLSTSISTRAKACTALTSVWAIGWLAPATLIG